MGHVHECASILYWGLGDTAAQTDHADDAYAAFVRAGDEQGTADALRERGKAAGLAGDKTTAAAIYAELATLAERIGDRWNGAVALNNLGDLALQAGDWATAVELCTRSSDIRTELGDRWGSALARGNVAIAKLQLGEVEDAAATLEHALRESLAAGASVVVSMCIDAAIFVATTRGDYHHVAVLIGVANRMQEELGSTREPLEQSWFSESLEKGLAALGDETFAAEVERGATLSLEDAAGAALRALAN